MGKERTTLMRHTRCLSELQVCLLVVVIVLLSSACVAAKLPATSHCLPEEGVFFSCRLKGNNKIISICTAPKVKPFTSLTYRYGTEAKVELTFISTADNQNRFFGTVSAVNPKTTVREVWFDVDGIRYITTACVGGDCPHSGGLIVYQRSRLLMSRPCVTESSSHPWFSSEVLRFGSDLDSSHSNTELIRLKDVDNDINVLYPWSRVN